MLDELKKKKMLARLNQANNVAQKDVPEESTEAKKGYLRSIKGQGADLETMKMLMGPKQKPTMADKPVYEEMKKVPLSQQLEMMRDHTDEFNKSARESQQEESPEEKKRRMLENMFGRKGNA